MYVPGHLLFVRQTTVYAYPFDDEQLKLTGAPFEVADGALRNYRRRWVRTRCRQRRMARSHFELVWRGRTTNSSGSIGRGTTFGVWAILTTLPRHLHPRIWIKRPFCGAMQPEMPTCGSWKRGAAYSAASRLTPPRTSSRTGPATAGHPVFVEPECRVGALPETRDWRR